MKPGFSKLVVEYLPEPKAPCCFSPFRIFSRRKQRLLEPLIYTRPDGSSYIVEVGFESDGPSFPLITQPFLPERSRVFESGVYHDALIRGGEARAWADAEFRQALRSQKIGPKYAYVCYLALRLRAAWVWLTHG